MSNKNIFKFAVLSMLVFLGIFISFNLCKADPAQGEELPGQIVDMTVDAIGRIQIQVTSTTDYYYVLYRHRDLQDNVEWPVSMKLGEEGTTTLTEQLGVHGPFELYSVVQHRYDEPADTDGDGIDDVEELLNPTRLSPLNPASEIDIIDGAVFIPDRSMFQELSYQGLNVIIDIHLMNLEYVKFYILESDSDNPQVYFMNTETHRAHMSFAGAVGISGGMGGGMMGGGDRASGQLRGEIVYHPNVIASNGEPGVYRFEFEPNNAFSFATVQMAYELLAVNMPVLRNNLYYYPMPNSALSLYWQEKDLYNASRVAILLEEDIYANVSYLSLNVGEGYGLLRLMDLDVDELPTSRDIVIYEALPNEMTRVGGIITTGLQTPLSHVNLRAIQDNVPNAFIEDALENETISSLIGKYVYFKVEADGYEIRESTPAEVEAHYADLRPTEPQIPIRDLSVTQIMPLDEIGFEQSASFGVKTANVATLRTFGFPEGTIPDGFGVPFYFYDEFMKYNGFYEEAAAMLENPEFQQDFTVQDEMLSDFRDTIKDGDMPNWMWDALTQLQSSFPEGTSIRCRSSTNNEDLPGFSGAGFYTSKTQHPDEGHISKSIKQVYASLWNFRAFDERQFYRIDHFAAAMGVLVHPNFSNEQANGVGVTMDPFYMTQDTYYLNTQVGEDLVTNPEALSIPEEILLSANDDGGYTIVRPSNKIAAGEQILSVEHLNEQMMMFSSMLNLTQSAIESVFPSNATQADTNVAVTITLSQDMAMLPPNIIPLSVMIGQLEGSDIARDGLQITAVFDIPANEPTGMKDVSVALPPPPMDPNAQPMIFTKADAFEIVRGYLPYTIGQTTTDDIVTDIPTFAPGGLYDETVLRTIYLEFSQEDWWQQLEANFSTGVNILADLTMDGNTYHDVGIRFRGTTSYMMTGDSKKKPFNIEIDETYPDQRLMGYKTLNLNNANMDPSFIREVLYFNIFRRYAPCPQANFVKLVINGEDWGIYVNVQQHNSDLIEEWFEDNDGDRWKVGMRGGQGGFPPFQSLEEWLAGPIAEDLNNDGQINEVDFDIYIQSQPGGGMFDPNMFGDPNMRPPGGGMFDPNFIFVPPTLQEWLASPMAQDLNNDGQITEEDYDIFIKYPPPGGGIFDPNMFDDPNMIPGGWGGDPNMMPPPGGGMKFGGGNGALTWLGSDVAAYEQAYELKSEHTPDPWANLIAACDVLNNTPLDQLAEIADNVLAVDRWLWFLAMENIFTDEDSYLTKGWDYQIYYDPKTGQIRPLQHDGNETFISRFVNQSPFEGEDVASRPVISRLMAIPQFRERYLAHIRTILEESLDWDVVAPQIEAYRALIADEVQADTKKLYSYNKFEASFLDIQNFINGRRNYLLSHPEINRPIPEISSVVRKVTIADRNSVLPGQPVWIIATVQVGSDIEQGILYYTAGKGPFEQVSMFFADVNGNPDDAEVLVGEIPPFPAGSLIRYYVEVRTADDGEGNSFAPYNAEDYIFAYRVFMPIADSTPIVINELMARNQTNIQDPQGDYDDWIELLNISDLEIDLSGMYLSDKEDNPLKWEIPEGTTLAPGAYLIIWADEDGGDEPGLHANFKLSASGEMVLLVDKSEQGNALLDSVEFGEQETDVSSGRYPNGTGEFVIMSVPTPNEENYLDNDGDGYSPGEGDCDDDNPDLNPGAIEVYDEVDNDCDGLVDEEIAVIAKVSPSSGKKGDDVTATITLIEEMTTILPDMDLLSVKIGLLEGTNISRDGLKIKAVFDIPANKTKGMYDVSVEFQRSDGHTIIFAKSDAFEVRAGNIATPGYHYGWYIGNHYGWYNPVTQYMSQSWSTPQSSFGFGQKSWSVPQSVFGFGQQSWFPPQNISGFGQQNWYGLPSQSGYNFGVQGWNDFNSNNWFGYITQPGFGGLFQNGFRYPPQTGLGFEFEDWFNLF